ncbi:MAG: hypothetical protein AAF550_10860, partial [Myxococcota bacterium]
MFDAIHRSVVGEAFRETFGQRAGQVRFAQQRCSAVRAYLTGPEIKVDSSSPHTAERHLCTSICLETLAAIGSAFSSATTVALGVGFHLGERGSDTKNSKEVVNPGDRSGLATTPQRVSMGLNGQRPARAGTKEYLPLLRVPTMGGKPPFRPSDHHTTAGLGWFKQPAPRTHRREGVLAILRTSSMGGKRAFRP